MDPPIASRVVLSYPAGLSTWGRDQIETDRYRGYFRRILGEVAVGDEYEEFVDVGCCGDSLDIPFRIERIEDGDGRPIDLAIVDADTAIAYTARDGDVAGGWLVQSAAGPQE